MTKQELFQDAHCRARRLRQDCCGVLTYAQCFRQALRNTYEIERCRRQQAAVLEQVALEEAQFRAECAGLVAEVAHLHDYSCRGGLVVDPATYDAGSFLYTRGIEAWREGRR